MVLRDYQEIAKGGDDVWDTMCVQKVLEGRARKKETFD